MFSNIYQLEQKCQQNEVCKLFCLRDIDQDRSGVNKHWETLENIKNAPILTKFVSNCTL